MEKIYELKIVALCSLFIGLGIGCIIGVVI